MPVERDGARRIVDAAADLDPVQFAGLTAQLAPVVGDLDPVAVGKSQHAVLADAVDDDVELIDQARDPCLDGGVVAGPFERRGAERTRGMYLDAIELVLEALVAACRRHQARIEIGHRRGSGGQPPGRRRSRRPPGGNLVERRGAGGAGRDPVQEFDLPDRLPARGGVDAERDLDQLGILELGDLAIPHVEVDQIGTAGDGRCGGAGKMRLLVERNSVGAKEFGERPIPHLHAGAVIVGEQALNIHPTATDQQARHDLERIRRLARYQDRTARIERASLRAPVDGRALLVPVAVGERAALLQPHSAVVRQRVEGLSAVIPTHVTPPRSTIVALDLGFSSRRKFLIAGRRGHTPAA